MYRLELTEQDMRDISFVGTRYAWSTAILLHCDTGVNEIPEHVAWEIAEAIEADTAGGHSLFPMLDGRSELAVKLIEFWSGIV